MLCFLKKNTFFPAKGRLPEGRECVVFEKNNIFSRQGPSPGVRIQDCRRAPRLLR